MTAFWERTNTQLFGHSFIHLLFCGESEPYQHKIYQGILHQLHTELETSEMTDGKKVNPSGHI